MHEKTCRYKQSLPCGIHCTSERQYCNYSKLKEEARRKNTNSEKFLHELIFPVRATSEDVSYEAHNLWLIDERLTYSQYLASDISLGASAGKKRPDLLLLDHPVLVSDEDGPGHTLSRYQILELKRPMRDNYDGKDNPIDQLQEYAEKIKEGNAIDATGRPIRVNENTRIYLYAVCDVPASLEK